LGSVSGAHVNPAITIGLLSIKKINWKDAVGYVLAQFAGAALAMILVRLHGVSMPSIEASFTWTGLVAELLATFVFAFGVARIVSMEDTASASIKAPFVVGGSLALGVTLAVILGSNAVLNPAVAFGITSFGIVYVVGPVIGAIAGFWAEKVLR
jgi:aquaporin NIP